jgi:4-carboxymuconolactone decarboxylase
MSEMVRGRKKLTNAEMMLRGLARVEPEVVDTLLDMQIENVDLSGLDPKTYAMVKIAGLVSSDAPPASYVWQVGMAQESGVTEADIMGILVALAPTIGFVRITSAARKLALALGYQIEEAMAERA